MMAETVDTLLAQLEALQRARASGTRETEFTAGNGSSRRVVYKTDAEMAAAIADLQSRIAPLNGAAASNSIIIRSSKGW